MPASRSRTDRWQQCLQQIHQRGGSIEITPDREGVDGPDLLWRVRLNRLSDDAIDTELPGAMGRSFTMEVGTRLIGVMTIGQNRWMFHTTITALLGEQSGRPAMRLAMPERVERCQRRNFDRISTASVQLPPVRCWTLIEPASAVAAEIANRTHVLDLSDADLTGTRGDAGDEPAMLPEVGPPFKASLANIGGGGVGLRVEQSERSALEGTRLYWLSIDLRPHVSAPIAMTARLAHTHIDSAQNTYAGMAFEFGLNPEHRGFVLDQVQKFLRRSQIQSRSD